MNGQSDEIAGTPAQLTLSDVDKAAFDASMMAAEDYTPGPDSTEQVGVPRGRVAAYRWSSKHVYPGTERDYWLYIPQQYDGSATACLMVFQDGQFYLGEEVRAPIVFDSLIHQRAMPVTIGLFVSPATKALGCRSGAAATIAASSMTHSATSMRASCSTSCCRWLNRTTGSSRIRPGGRSAG
jgi:hypothetical protein